MPRSFSFLALALWVFVALPVSAKDSPLSVPIAFEPNRGQAAPAVRYLARANGQTIFLADQEIVLGAAKKNSNGIVRMHFVGAAATVPGAEIPTGGVVNYYLSGDIKNALTHLPLFSKVRYPSLYRGVDSVFHANGSNLEFDFELAPGATPENIAFTFDGADRVMGDADGGIDIQSGEFTWHLRPPQSFQASGGRRIKVESRYSVSDAKVISFHLGRFDRSLPLTIDPVFNIPYCSAQTTI